MNRKLESKRIIETELYDYYCSYGCDYEYCNCHYCVHPDDFDREWYWYWYWEDSQARKRKIDWFIDGTNTIENISKIKKQ